MNTAKGNLGVLILAALLVASYWYLTSQNVDVIQAEAVPTASPLELPQQASAATLPLDPADERSQTAIAVGTPTSGPLEKYQRLGSMRPFVLKALNEPSERSTFYVLNAISECAALENTGILANPQPRGRHPRTDEPLALNNEMQVRQVEVSRYWNERCRDFTLDKLKQFHTQVQQLLDQGRDELDSAKSAFIANAGANASREGRLQALRDVFAKADPMLIDRLGLRIGLYGRPGGGIDFYFEGTRYRVNDADDIISAVHLLPCGLGLRCDANEFSLAEACISYGECYESRFDAFQNGMMAGDPARYARTIGFYERMLASIKAGRAEDFVP